MSNERMKLWPDYVLAEWIEMDREVPTIDYDKVIKMRDDYELFIEGASEDYVRLKHWALEAHKLLTEMYTTRSTNLSDICTAINTIPIRTTRKG